MSAFDYSKIGRFAIKSNPNIDQQLIMNSVKPVIEMYHFFLEKGEHKVHDFKSKDSVILRKKLNENLLLNDKVIFAIFNAIDQLTKAGEISIKILNPVLKSKMGKQKVDSAKGKFFDFAEPITKAIDSTFNKVLLTAGAGILIYGLLRSSKNGD